MPPKDPAPRPPSYLLTALEAPRVIYEKSMLCIQRPWINRLPKNSDGHPVMVIPGFASNDADNQPLIDFINQQGYNAAGWERGRNFGHGLLDTDILVNRIKELYQLNQQRVTLIGHSLGGVYAREIAKLCPDEVRQVITLGSPFGGGRNTASRANILYKLLSPHSGADDDEKWAEAPTVPTTAIYSRTDGILNWRIALQKNGHQATENIEVYGSHSGMTVHPAIWYIINDRLGQDESNWQAFKVKGFIKWAFPKPAWRAHSPSVTIVDSTSLTV
jgi:pimeloyl-ACP methyl ester carboxylesterase